jgi:hypothetical protein
MVRLHKSLFSGAIVPRGLRNVGVPSSLRYLIWRAPHVRYDSAIGLALARAMQRKPAQKVSLSAAGFIIRF